MTEKKKVKEDKALDKEIEGKQLTLEKLDIRIKNGQKELEAIDQKLTEGLPLDLGEVGDPGPIEKVSESDFIKFAELEEFMNQKVLVIVHDDASDNSVVHPCPNVNGVNQGFIRGRKQWVKRKYVEALARGRVTKYEQRTTDASRPENIQMEQKTALCYPFSVLSDPDPRGRAWFDAIMAQP